MRQRALFWGLDDFQQEDQANPQKCQTTREFPKLIGNSWSHILPISGLLPPPYTRKKGRKSKHKTQIISLDMHLSTSLCYLLFLQDQFGMLLGLLMLQALLRCEVQWKAGGPKYIFLGENSKLNPNLQVSFNCHWKMFLEVLL